MEDLEEAMFYAVNKAVEANLVVKDNLGVR